ncbi:MAG: carbohydrate binding family 9 domain-containing protein [Cyclobacteriaceae bacterium]|nr:carbohydrate binding family 9 domain-containing protein [Cyclobacteriaceae bacterium]
MKFFVSLVSLLSIACGIQAQNDSLKSYTTKQVSGTPPIIDGILDDPAWEEVPWSTEQFRQLAPDAGKPASVQTQFKILYDAKNLYVAFLNLDPEPNKIVSRMSRRDGFEGDLVEINIDSYYDRRSAFSFTASVSGVKGDEYISNNGNDWDRNWDPIWYLKTSIVKEGWVAEMRIPLSQLRFADKPEHVWGLQIMRLYFRNQERSNWQYIPPDAGGWVHLFGDLKGIQGIKPQKQLEIQPYVVAKTEQYQKEEGNPFLTGKSSSLDAGLDAKIGITSDITLDLTVNPDFGQVEADPSQVNLSAFELFFQERRPFFIEGNNTLNFPITDFNPNNLFYSRRVGRQPQGYVDTDPLGDDGVSEYVNSKTNTTILGAAKLTGKNKHGFSWGILESVTASEKATIDSLGIRRKQEIEPLTNYFTARAQQDINKGNTLIGGMITATTRNIQSPALDWLHKKAYSGGIDVMHHWKNRTYYVSLKTLVSHVKGSEASITETQLASERYFQRPDNDHARVDTTRKSLTGTGGTLVLGKKSGKLVYDIGYSWLSPELELNDIGFLMQTDLMTQWVWAQYRILNPIGIFRWMRFNAVQYTEWDFDWRNLSTGYNANARFQFKNFWVTGMGGEYGTHNVSNADLRGGPALHYPGSINYWFFIATDSRKKLMLEINPQWQWGLNHYQKRASVEVELTYRPTNALSLSVSPSLTKSVNEMQYVSTASYNGQSRYIVGEIDQSIFRVSMRATYMVTPNLSIQYWGQPFGSSGIYSEFKNITNANAAEYQSRYTPIPVEAMNLNDGIYHVDENQDGVTDYSFDKPDFNFGQFRSNMVVRWEYIPGSTLFLVWTQEKNGAFYDPSSPGYNRYAFEFNDQPHNIFLLKYTYRFVL